MLNLTDRKAVDAALDAGNGLYLEPLFLLADGSVRNIANQQVVGADVRRAASFAEYKGFTPATAANLNVLAITSFIKPLLAVATTAPAVTGLELGVQFFNSTDKKLYVLVAATDPADPNAWAENDPDITAGGSLWYVPSGTSAGLYHWSSDTLALI